VDFDLSSDQTMLLSSIGSLLERFRKAPAGVHRYVEYSSELQTALIDSGFLEVASQNGYGPLDAALLAEEIATCPISVEATASALISPLLGKRSPPVAIAWELNRPVRFLNHAKTVVLMQGDGVLIGTPTPMDIEQIDSIVAYPLAALKTIPRDAERMPPDAAAAVRRRALTCIAVEAAGLMRGALDRTVEFVKERRQFGQPLGNFQAIQHRLAEDAQIVHACRSLAFRAAFADDEKQAAVACLYVQDAIRKIIYDCHQFTGAMGLTLEYPLHLWTYRLKVLQGEAGGTVGQGERVAQHVWPAEDRPHLASP
jgi:alkylation response protein AidB-like acyl-CoA dehydrogenase